MKRILHISPLIQGLVLAMIVGIVALIFQPVLIASAPAKVDTSTPLLVASRGDLAICVQAIDPEVNADVAPVTVKAGIASLGNHRLWQYYAPFKTVVEYGCPGTPYLTKYPNATSYPAIPRTTTPTKYRLFVYIMPEEWIQTNLPDGEKRDWVQEALCEDNNCASVSEGVYISPSEMHNPAQLRDILARGLGLETSVPMIPNIRPRP